MGASREGEPELCEECGSPLEDGFCNSCGGGFQEGASPVGAAPLNKNELSSVLGRWVGSGAHGSYSLSMQQDEGMAPLRKEIDLLVEQFNASPEVRDSVKQNSERIAVKLLGELGPTKAAIASVAHEFMKLGRNVFDVSLCISRIHPRIGKRGDLVIEVYPTSSEVGVLIDGRERPFKSHTNGLYRKLRLPLFMGDGGATVELKNARLTRKGYDGKRVKPLGPSKFVVCGDDKNFELFKLLEAARLSGEFVGSEVETRVLLRKYSISKLPLTEKLLREAGVLQAVSADYARRYSVKIRNGRGRSPRKLAEEAMTEACETIIPPPLSSSMVRTYHLKPSAMKSLIVKREFEAWQS